VDAESVNPMRRRGEVSQPASDMTIVTGAAKGLGRAIAALCAERGRSVALLDRDSQALCEVEAECRAQGVEVFGIRTDVTDPDDVEAAFSLMRKRELTVRALVNVAGIYPGATLEQTTNRLWNEVIATNLTGAFHMCRAAVPSMKAAGGGVILNIASRAGVVGEAGMSAYAASKGGVIALTLSLAKELADVDIRVNAIAPGAINTMGLRAEDIEALGMAAPAAPLEIAELALFLVSNESSYIRGTVVEAYGRWLA
jgi:2-dehydro-3-deoxy-L-rhamnonate dehydrogenase (NAD+)